jgi:CRP/FNR family cyclic AMP-dependent transcriptional regulator
MAKRPASDRGRELLEKSTIFGTLDEKARREIAAYAKPRSYTAGAQICRLGDQGDSMMAIVVGTVRISLPAVKGREIILADLPPGELFGEIALLDGKPRSANATALTNCELMVLERRDVMPFLDRNPSVCIKLMEILCSRIRRSGTACQDTIALSHHPAGCGEAFPFTERIGSDGRWDAGKRQPLSSRMATSWHSGIEGSLDYHPQARGAA